LTGSDRRNLDYLLENIIDPSASVPQSYRLTVVELKDGQILSGFVEEDLGSLPRLRAQVHHLSRDRIVKRKALKASLMPEGILNGLGDGEVRDLFAYLRGREQVK
jgi:putative heme-binding domain-containing protein